MDKSPPSAKAFFKPRTYDFLKMVAQIFLPALGTLYFGLSEIWGLPYGPEVVGTITVVDLFLGAILGVSSAQYYRSGANFDGDVKYIPEEDGGRVRFEFERDPAEVIEDEPGKHSMEFRVQRQKEGDI
jgi:hypothetical protein